MTYQRASHLLTSVRAFVADPDMYDRLASSAVLAWDALQEDGMAGALAMLAEGEAPALLLVGIEPGAEPEDTAKHLLAACAGRCPLILIGSTNDLTLYRSLKALGVADYLVVDEIDAPLLQRMMHLHIGAPEAERVKTATPVVAVVGCRGGVGASSLAGGIALETAKRSGDATLLIDLDPSFGTQALSFDCDAGTGYLDCLREPDRLDSLLLESAIIPLEGTLSLLAAEATPEETEPLTAETVGALLSLSAEHQGRIVVDAGRGMLPALRRNADRIDHIILAMDGGLPSLRDAIRMRAYLLEAWAPDRILMVFCRDGRPLPGGLGVADFARALETTIDFTLPEIVQGADKALTGRPVTVLGKGGSALSPLIDRLLGIANAADPPKRRFPLFRKGA